MNGHRNPFKTGGPQDEEIMVYFIKCNCHIWAVVSGWQARRCGECGEYGEYCAPPRSGKTERLRIDHGYEED